MTRPKIKIFKKKNFPEFFFYFFFHPNPLKHLRKVENNFLKVPMPQMTNFQKNRHPPTTPLSTRQAPLLYVAAEFKPLSGTAGHVDVDV